MSYDAKAGTGVLTRTDKTLNTRQDGTWSIVPYLSSGALRLEIGENKQEWVAVDAVPSFHGPNGPLGGVTGLQLSKKEGPQQLQVPMPYHVTGGNKWTFLSKRFVDELRAEEASQN